MIVHINGPFGVGKTTTAKLLVERLPNAMFYDPEIVGYVLRRLPFIRKPKDYQESRLWRALVPLAARLLRAARRSDLVIPITVWRRDHLEEISSGLRKVDRDLRIFQLTAEEDELQRRIVSDLEDEPARPWRMAHVESGMAMAGDPLFGEEISTDGRMPAEVVEVLLHRLSTSPHNTVSP